MEFINKKIFEVYGRNIGKGLTIKRLMKLNQEQIYILFNFII